MYLPRARGSYERAGEAALTAAHHRRAPDDAGFALDVERYPGGSRQRLGVFDFHGEWLDWGK
jgi:hypothetical protein